MPAANPNPPQPPPEDTESAVLRQRFDDHVTKVEGFMEAQVRENQRIYDLVNNSNQRVFTKLEEMGAKVDSRGRISSGFIFGLVAILVSVITLLSGVIHFYVSQQTNLVKEQLENTKNSFTSHVMASDSKFAALASKMDNAYARITEEELRSVRTDAESRVQREHLQKGVDEIYKRRDRDDNEEIARLRALVDRLTAAELLNKQKSKDIKE